jgi:hypothetical protein
MSMKQLTVTMETVIFIVIWLCNPIKYSLHIVVTPR